MSGHRIASADSGHTPHTLALPRRLLPPVLLGLLLLPLLGRLPRAAATTTATRALLLLRPPLSPAAATMKRYLTSSSAGAGGGAANKRAKSTSTSPSSASAATDAEGPCPPKVPVGRGKFCCKGV